MKPFKTCIRFCARCGKNHDYLKFKPFTRNRNNLPFSHWALCPISKEPILLQCIEE